MFRANEQLQTGTIATRNDSTLNEAPHRDGERLEARIQRGHRLRAEAFANFGHGLAHGIADLVSRQAQAYSQWREVRDAERELRSLSPQVLRDIGIEGHQIPAVARGLDPRSKPQRRAPVAQIAAKSDVQEPECCMGQAA